MNPVIISTDRLSLSPRTLADDARQTRFTDLPLPARLLLAVPRVRGQSSKAPLAERYVLDTLGRIIDAGPERRHTIEAVNLLAEVLLSPAQLDNTGPIADRSRTEKSGTDKRWLSAIENVVLCVLCKVRSGDTEGATNLMNHWLGSTTVESFNTAAQAVCDSECFKRGGPHVFTPGWNGSLVPGTLAKHRSVIHTRELSLGESVLLNALRLRMRTLAYSGINVRVVPLLRKNLALPRIETMVDAHLIEALQRGINTVDIRCLCCADISADEAHYLASVAAFSTGDASLIAQELGAWLSAGSVERLQARTGEFQNIVQNLGAPMPLRDWNIDELHRRAHLKKGCQHISEPSMIH